MTETVKMHSLAVICSQELIWNKPSLHFAKSQMTKHRQSLLITPQNTMNPKNLKLQIGLVTPYTSPLMAVNDWLLVGSIAVGSH